MVKKPSGNTTKTFKPEVGYEVYWRVKGSISWTYGVVDDYPHEGFIGINNGYKPEMNDYHRWLLLIDEIDLMPAKFPKEDWRDNAAIGTPKKGDSK